MFLEKRKNTRNCGSDYERGCDEAAVILLVFLDGYVDFMPW